MRIRSLLFAIWTFSASCFSSETALTIYTEEFPPYNFLQKGKVVGVNADIVAMAGAGAGLLGGGIHAQIFGEQTSAVFWLAIFILVCTVCGLNLKGKISTGKTVLLCMVFMALGGGLTALGGGLMQWGWAVFHILVIVLQAFIFMMLTIVYLSMAHQKDEH